MRDYSKELEKRVAFIRYQLKTSGAKGVIFGNSGGKDSALVGILCKKATDNVLGVIMPCQSKRNFEEDTKDGMEVADKFNIKTVTVDLSDTKTELTSKISKVQSISAPAGANIAPRLRMTTLYAIGQSLGYLVAGTGNASEVKMGYYTKWGDGAHDFNPISDLTVTEIYEFLRFLDAPESIIKKAPSAGLFDGQTDEAEMGITYKEIDDYILYGKGDEKSIEKIEAAYKKNEHKRSMPKTYQQYINEQGEKNEY